MSTLAACPSRLLVNLREERPERVKSQHPLLVSLVKERSEPLQSPLVVH